MRWKDKVMDVLIGAAILKALFLEFDPLTSLAAIILAILAVALAREPNGREVSELRD